MTDDIMNLRLRTEKSADGRCQTGGAPKITGGAGRKLAVALHRMLKDGTTFILHRRARAMAV